MEKQPITLLPAIAVIALLSCTATGNTGDKKTGPAAITMTTTTETAKVEPPDTVAVTGVAMDFPKSIAGTIAEAKELTTLIAAIRAARFDSLLQYKGPFTVFASDNEAFNDLPVGIVDVLLEAKKKEALQNILAYHIVAGVYTSSSLENGTELVTLQGGKLKVRHKDGHWWINDARVVAADISCDNGALWVIDKVLLPR